MTDQGDNSLFTVLGESEVDSVKGPRLDSPMPDTGASSPTASPQSTQSPPQGRSFGRSRSSAVRFTNKAAADSSPLLQKPNRNPIAEETRSLEENGMSLSVVAIQGWRKTMEDHHTIALRGEQRVPNEVAHQRCLQVSISGQGLNVTSPITPSIQPTEGSSPSVLPPLDLPPTALVNSLALEPPFEAFLGVYDGHQNANTSQFLKERLHALLIQELSHLKQVLGEPPTTNIEAAIQLAFNNAFTHADMEHRAQTGVVHGGSTVGVAVVTTHYVLLANLGDCRAAVLTTEGGAVSLEKEHRLGVNEEEKQRVILTGTSVDKDRVGGVLAVSRAMGDYAFKPEDKPVEMRPVSVLPEVLVIPREEGHEFVVVGCDGVWELQSVSSIQEQLQACLLGHEKFGCETVYRIVNMCSSTSVSLTDKSGVQPGCDNVTLGILKLR